jgi:hypothetical protein
MAGQRDPWGWFTLAGVFGAAGVSSMVATLLAASTTIVINGSKGQVTSVASNPGSGVLAGYAISAGLFAVAGIFLWRGMVLEKRLKRLEPLRTLETWGLILDERANAQEVHNREQCEQLWNEYKTWRAQVEDELRQHYAAHLDAFLACDVDEDPNKTGWCVRHVKAITASAATLRRILEHLSGGGS